MKKRIFASLLDQYSGTIKPIIYGCEMMIEV